MARLQAKPGTGAFSWRDLPFWGVWVWPVLTVLALILLWCALVWQIQGERRSAVSNALHHAESVNRAYVQYVERTVRQMDQVTRFVVYEHNDSMTDQMLQELSRQIMVPGASPVMLSVSDATGRITRSSSEIPMSLSIADRDYFNALKDHPSSAVVVAPVKLGKVTRRPSVQIARQLKFDNGHFSGIAVLSLPPQFLTSVYRPDDLGANGLLAVAGTDGYYRAMQAGPIFRWGDILADKTILTQSSGGEFMGAESSFDHKARFVAWHKVEGYPLIALAGVSAEEKLAGYEAVKALYLQAGAVMSVLLLLFGVGTTVLCGRLEIRRRAVLEAKEAYRTASEGTSEGFFVLRPVHDMNGAIADFVVTDANARGAAMAGRPGGSLTDARLSDIIQGRLFEETVRRYAGVVLNGRRLDEAEVEINEPGPFQGKWISHRAVPARQGLAVTLRDLTKIKQHEASLVFVANHDAVTRLPNRNWLQTYLPQALSRAQEAREKLGVFFIDLDDFKKVNDTLGHAAGDQLLGHISDRLKRMSRDSDVVCRLGGDEFTLIVQGGFSREDLERMGARIVDTLAQPFELEGQTILVGASVGISVFPDSGTSAPELLKNADLAMYSAKESGKGLFEFFSPGLSSQVEGRVALERELHAALQNGEFFLVYQPKVDLTTQETRGFEALLRWSSPVRGLVPPLDFIELAEKTGLILPIGERVIDMTCAQLSAWRAQGLALLPVSVNVSPRQLRRGNLASLLSSTLRRYDIPATLLEIELTESSMMEDPEHSQRQLLAIKELGVRVLVDDFGTGYSSLAMLKRFEVDVLKVDRSFVSDIPQDPEDCAILSAVVSMANALKMEVVAEGVETIEQREFLASLGCQQGQGYFFSRPVRAEELTAWFPARMPATEVPAPATPQPTD